jgi:dipeptidyl-peptidase-4
MRRFALLLCSSFVLVFSGDAGAQRRLTLEDVFSADPERRVDFAPALPKVEWLDDQSLLLIESDLEKQKIYLRLDVGSGARTPLFDVERFRRAFAALPGVDEEAAAELSRSTLHFSADHTAALLRWADDLFYYRLGAEEARRLTFDPEPEVGEELSPDGRWVSFIRGYDLYVLELDSGHERRLTAGGNQELLFGRLDWVYQEELYGRGNFKGYWWSPDSRHLVFLRLDESPVREFTVVDHLPIELELEVTNYPKAGSPNPRATLGVVAVGGGATRWLDTTRYETFEHLIVRVGWTPDSKTVVFQVQDREQTWLDLVLAPLAEESTTTLLREESPAFVNVLAEPQWLADGSFLWLSERTGHGHLYHYGRDGGLRSQLTAGDWEVRELYGVSDATGEVYYQGMEHDPIAPHIYRLALAGGERVRISQSEGSHAAQWSPDFERYVDTWSEVAVPPQIRLHGRGGEELRAIAAEPAAELDDFTWGPVEHLEVATRDGFVMEAMLIKPPDFDPAKRYPVLQYNYGGPHSPLVKKAWGGDRYLWSQVLAQMGYVVWICDNRSASGKGIAPTWQAYQRMGVVELRDIEDGVAWLEKQPWVDPERIGIWGWSYGGFLAAYALTHSQSFSMGIAGAPVTDWRLYDSIYTERFMRMPQNNPEGYAETSVLEAAANLHGALLIIHGTTDDNVHLQNSIKLVHELQKAGKDFELMLYPRSRHGFVDREQIEHLYRTMTAFVVENL